MIAKVRWEYFCCLSFPKCACPTVHKSPDKIPSHKKTPLNLNVVWQWKSRIIVVHILKRSIEKQHTSAEAWHEMNISVLGKVRKKIMMCPPAGYFLPTQKSFLSNIHSIIHVNFIFIEFTALVLFCKFSSWDFSLFIWVRTTKSKIRKEVNAHPMLV